MALEDLEKELYSGQFEKKKTSRKKESPEEETEIEKNTAHEWKDDEKEEYGTNKKTSRVARIVFFAFLGILGLAVFVGGILFFSRFGGSRNVDVEVYAPSSISRGVPFDVTVSAVNRLDTALENAIIELRLPQKLILLTKNNGTKRVISNEEVGVVKGGEIVKKEFKVVSVADANTVQKITAALVYTGDRSGRFEATGMKEVNVSNSAITLEVKKPDFVFIGSVGEFSVIYKNTSEVDLPELTVQVQYPPSFKFISASVAPDSFENYWRVGMLKAGEEKKITIKGLFSNATDGQSVFPVSISATFFGSEYKLIEQSVSIAPDPAPVGFQIFANGNASYVSRLGDTIQYSIRYENLTGVALADVTIKATVSGSLVDLTTINTKGTVNSISGIVTWTSGNIPALKLIDPGASDEVTMTVRLKPTFPSSRLSDKNFLVKVNAQFDSPSVPYYLSTPRTTAVASLDTRIGGGILIDARVLHYDVLSGISNDGPIPPRANQPTKYTVHWILRNFSTDIQDAVIKAQLPAGVSWMGIMKNEPGSSLVFDESSREVVWTMSRVSAMRGVTSDPIDIIFQIEATPISGMIGRYQTLVGQTTAKAIDGFTNSELTSQDVNLTTELSDDNMVGKNAGIVIP
ncbi:MAG: hypothetical protein AAB503_01835 [Patescibacteria group bacterium]|mgnify:CR=1 FL=1